MIPQKLKYQLALFLAILFHVSGCIGILFTPYKDWFVQNTSLNLLLMLALLIWVQEDKGWRFWFFAILAFATGMITEMIGVNTGLLFGNYAYGDVMGVKWNGVPLLIGVNWFVVVFSAGTIMQLMHDWVRNRVGPDAWSESSIWQTVSLLLDGALLATFFDWIMEPVAMKLGFWNWKDAQIPFYNYVCWFVISLLLLVAFRYLKPERNNQFALHLLIIQALFFLTLRSYL